jgi:hypothetical protein
MWNWVESMHFCVSLSISCTFGNECMYEM